MDLSYTKKGKSAIAILKEKCDLCGCCIGVCPEDALELTKLKLSLIAGRCTICIKCVWCCPVEALLYIPGGEEVE